MLMALAYPRRDVRVMIRRGWLEGERKRGSREKMGRLGRSEKTK